jgi:hypothetical protein
LVQTLVATAPATTVLISNPITAAQDQVIYSKDDIIIKANLKSINGAKLFIRSKKSITVESGVKIDDLVFLEINNEVYTGKWPQNPLTIDIVQDFCDKKSPDGLVYAADRFQLKPTSVQAMPTKNFVSNDLNVYPNPAFNNLTIHSSKLARFVRKEIFDAKGSLIKKIDNDLNQIDVSDLPNGFYFIKIFDIDGSMQSAKFAIQK